MSVSGHLLAGRTPGGKLPCGVLGVALHLLRRRDTSSQLHRVPRNLGDQKMVKKETDMGLGGM